MLNQALNLNDLFNDCHFDGGNGENDRLYFHNQSCLKKQ